MNIYELGDQYNQLLDLLRSDEFADDEVIQRAFDNISDQFDQKAESYVFVLKQLKADAQTLKDEIDRLSARKKRFEENAKKIQSILQDEMERTGKDKIKTPRFSIWIQNNPVSLDVETIEKIPEEWLIPQEPKVDKRRLLLHLKQTGELVDGVKVVQTKGVRFK